MKFLLAAFLGLLAGAVQAQGVSVTPGNVVAPSAATAGNCVRFGVDRFHLSDAGGACATGASAAPSDAHYLTTQVEGGLSAETVTGTGVAAALQVNVGSAGAPVLFNGALGTPSSGTLTSATGLPVSTGVSGLGTGVATALATPSSANLESAITDELDPGGSGKAIFSPGGLNVTTGKTLASTNTLTLAGTDSSTLNIGTGGTLGSAALIATGTSGGTLCLLNANACNFSGTTTIIGNIVISASGRSRFVSSADGVMYVSNNALSGLTRFALGPDTTSFPALTPNGTTTEFRVGGGSGAFAPISASVGTFSSTIGGSDTITATKTSAGASTIGLAAVNSDNTASTEACIAAGPNTNGTARAAQFCGFNAGGTSGEAAATIKVSNGGAAATQVTINKTGTVRLGGYNVAGVVQFDSTGLIASPSAWAATTGSIGGGALLAGACASGTVAVTNSTTAMVVTASPVTYPGDGAYWMAYVSTAGTVTVKVCAAVALTPTASAYNVRVLQ